MRRLFTRCLGLVPALVVAAGLGRNGIDTLLVASQVVLSVVLPFVVFPLLWLTSHKSIMSVKRPRARTASLSPQMREAPCGDGASVTETATTTPPTMDAADPEAQPETETVDFSNGKIAIAVGSIIWIVIVLANVYAIVGLAMGEGS